ncbi:MAG: hypothetical protein HY870_07200 [Chloroflexi bacterium]|nr:hypothetical protein [Chloroflexota bacterium]
MIEPGVLPVAGIVALRAVRAIRALMRSGIIRLMAAHARLRRAFEHIVDVALLALDRAVLALQLEGRLIVIEGGVVPIVRGVAYRAIRAERSVMRLRVVLAMAVDASR